MVIYLLNADYEQAYISTFAKIFAILKQDYDVFINIGKEDNYEIDIKAVNNKTINDYLSICFQNQNGSLTIVSSLNIDDSITKKLVKDIALALNANPLASYNFTNLKDYIIYHFVYIKENIIINNKKILETLKSNNTLENLNYNIIISPYLT